MKRIAAIAAILCLLVLPVSAVPYTETELEEYMQAIYCEPIWSEDYPSFCVRFADIDLDGRKELISIETGEEYAPKQAHIYSFMDAELSHRGFVTIGKLMTCRDPQTNESFMVSHVRQNGEDLYQRLVLSHEAENTVLQELSADCVTRLEDYGYCPVTVTKEDCADIKLYAECRELFLPAYQNTVYTNGQPPLAETWDGETQQPDTSSVALWPGFVIAGAAAVCVTAALWWITRKKAR